MMFKKSTKSELFWSTMAFLILLELFIFLIYFISPYRNVVYIISNYWKVFTIIITVYAVLIIKINYDKNKAYIIQDDKIIFKGFGEIKELHINNIETIVDCIVVRSWGVRHEYHLYMKEGSEIVIRDDMYNENCEILYDVLKEKYKIKVVVTSVVI